LGNKRVFIASFNRASDGALSKLQDALEKRNMLVVGEIRIADYILAPGDRKETFEFCLQWYGKIPIIHLWAGEVSQGTHDEIYRWAITNMSMMQLCTNEQARQNVLVFCRAVGKEPDAHVVGNVMLDNMPENFEYDMVLYNPPTMLDDKEINEEIQKIRSLVGSIVFWLPPNGDNKSELIHPFVNCPNLSRSQFLSLVKNCRLFIGNSSCIDYEIKHIIPEDRIVRIGERNMERESRYTDMTIPDATNNIMKILEGL
jgi:UDP-N-acetylglucosamine 2-epimerase